MAEPTCICREAAPELLQGTCEDHANKDSRAKAFDGELPHAQKQLLKQHRKACAQPSLRL